VVALLALGWFGGILGGEEIELEEAAGASKGLELVEGTELFSGGGPAGGSNGFDMIMYPQVVVEIQKDKRRWKTSTPASPATCLGCLGTASSYFGIMIID
jgi:hypothetical protein